MSSDHHSGCTPIAPKSTSNDLQELIEAAKQHPFGSRERNYYLNQLIRAIAPKLWRENTPYYADAVQQTWIYFVKNVCTLYDPSRANVVTWVNVYLKFRHRDLLIQAHDRAKRELSIDGNPNEDNNLVYDLPAREMASLTLLEQVEDWVKTDPSGKLSSTHIKNRPDLNCQVLLLLRLPSQSVEWKQISERFGIPIPTLSAFYQRKCLPYLREFGTSEGFYSGAF